MGECEAICKALWWPLCQWKRYINSIYHLKLNRLQSKLIQPPTFYCYGWSPNFWIVWNWIEIFSVLFLGSARLIHWLKLTDLFSMLCNWLDRNWWVLYNLLYFICWILWLFFVVVVLNSCSWTCSQTFWSWSENCNFFSLM